MWRNEKDNRKNGKARKNKLRTAIRIKENFPNKVSTKGLPH